MVLYYTVACGMKNTGRMQYYLSCPLYIVFRENIGTVILRSKLNFRTYSDLFYNLEIKHGEARTLTK
jgi:hypothetical protein